MITIGITTYNRMHTLKMMAKSLYLSSLPDSYAIRIYDDASTDFSVDSLGTVFPDAVSIRRNEKNLGADWNTLSMYHDFCDSGDDFLLNADSDLLFSHDWYIRAMALMPDTDGILSLFNTPNHPIKSENGALCEKDTLGAAGTIFSRKRVQELCEKKKLHIHSPEAFSVDFEWSAFFRERGYRLFCTKESLVQHIGVWGHNSAHGKFDFGYGFKVDSLFNGQALNDTLEWASSWNMIQPKIYRMFPFKEIKEYSRIILYGAGWLGREYRKMLNTNRYCYVAAWVDKVRAGEVGIGFPQEMKKLNFDYIVLATTKADIAQSMRDDIQKIAPSFNSKIITSNFLY